MALRANEITRFCHSSNTPAPRTQPSLGILAGCPAFPVPLPPYPSPSVSRLPSHGCAARSTATRPRRAAQLLRHPPFLAELRIDASPSSGSS